MRFAVVAFMLAAVSAACAGRKGGCVPVARDIQAAIGLPVLSACEVTERARVIQHAALPDIGAPIYSVCYRADFDFVVDTDGIPLIETVRLATTNNSYFAQAAQAMLETARYLPAKVGTETVHQMVRYTMRFEYRGETRRDVNGTREIVQSC